MPKHIVNSRFETTQLLPHYRQALQDIVSLEVLLHFPLDNWELFFLLFLIEKVDDRASLAFNLLASWLILIILLRSIKVNHILDSLIILNTWIATAKKNKNVELTDVEEVDKTFVLILSLFRVKSECLYLKFVQEKLYFVCFYNIVNVDKSPSFKHAKLYEYEDGQVLLLLFATFDV